MTDPMKAVVLVRFGGADAFEVRDVSVPQVEPRQVRVRVHATAVNPLDYQIRRGDYADHVPLPAITQLGWPCRWSTCNLNWLSPPTG